jgi:hypothetical protein
MEEARGTNLTFKTSIEMFMAYNKIPQSQTFEFFEILKARSSARAFS